MAVINKSDAAPYVNDTVRSDADGNYELNINSISFGTDNITVYVSDIDGEENGELLQCHLEMMGINPCTQKRLVNNTSRINKTAIF